MQGGLKMLTNRLKQNKSKDSNNSTIRHKKQKCENMNCKKQAKEQHFDKIDSKRTMSHQSALLCNKV